MRIAGAGAGVGVEVGVARRRLHTTHTHTHTHTHLPLGDTARVVERELLAYFGHQRQARLGHVLAQHVPQPIVSRFQFLHTSTSSSHHIASHHIASHQITSHHIASHYIASHYVTSHRIASHQITLHRITSHRITSHHIAGLRVRDCSANAPSEREAQPTPRPTIEKEPSRTCSNAVRTCTITAS